MERCKGITNRKSQCSRKAIEGAGYCKQHLVSKLETKEKENLELKKLRLEINELDKRWWQKSYYLRALFPGLVTIAALIVTIFSTGYFDIEQKKLQNEKILLKIEINEFKDIKNGLYNSIAKLEVQRDSLISNSQRLISMQEEFELNQRTLRFEQNERRKLEQSNISSKNLIDFYKARIEDYEKRMLLPRNIISKDVVNQSKLLFRRGIGIQYKTEGDNFKFYFSDSINRDKFLSAKLELILVNRISSEEFRSSSNHSNNVIKIDPKIKEDFQLKIVHDQQEYVSDYVKLSSGWVLLTPK